MHRVRWSECCGGTSTSFNAASDTGARRSIKAAWNRTDTRHNNARAESKRTSGNTANKSDCTSWKSGHAASDAIANTTGRYGSGWFNYAVGRADARTSDSAIPGEAAPARAESDTFGCRQRDYIVIDERCGQACARK